MSKLQEIANQSKYFLGFGIKRPLLTAQCDESKPRCEYCIHTNRECVYPEQTVSDMSEDGELITQVERITDSQVTATQTALGKTFEGLTCELLLNSSTKMLNISTFELRLLNFFNSYCISLISFGVNMKADRTWRQEVPKLFLQSDLVRKAIYLFSSINLWPLCDFQSIIDVESDYSVQDLQKMDAIVDCALLKESLELESNGQDPNKNLYIKTSNYFMNTLANTGDILGRADANSKIDELTASELLVSGILIFAFLGIHPHRLVPLVSFDNTIETDFLSIVRGIRNTVLVSYEALATSDYIGVLPLIDSSVKTNIFTNTEAITPNPITMTLRAQISEFFENQDVGSESSHNCNTLHNSINTLELYMSKAILFNYPVPLFAWVLSLSDDLHSLIRAKYFLALRLLYVYACLNCITRFHIYDKKNMWLEFISWFKDYNFKLNNGQWQYGYDERLYRIAIIDNFKISSNFKMLGIFDPNTFFDTH